MTKMIYCIINAQFRHYIKSMGQTLDLETGDVTPKSMYAQGYTMTVIGVAEINLTKN